MLSLKFEDGVIYEVSRITTTVNIDTAEEKIIVDFAYTLENLPELTTKLINENYAYFKDDKEILLNNNLKISNIFRDITEKTDVTQLTYYRKREV